VAHTLIDAGLILLAMTTNSLIITVTARTSTTTGQHFYVWTA